MSAVYKSISPEQISVTFTDQPRIRELKKSMVQRITDAANDKFQNIERPATPDPRKREPKKT